MSKFWLIVQYEYERHVLKRGFWLGTLSLPAALAVAVGASAILRGAPATARALPLPGAGSAGQLLIALSGFAGMLLVMLSAGYWVGVVADEKANRTLEILVTSVPPRRLMAAKLLAVLAVTLTQLVVWGIAAGLLALLGRNLLDLAWLQDLRVAPSTAWIVAAVLIPSYVLAAALLAALGATLQGHHATQHVTTLLAAVTLTPAMFALSMLHDLDHPLMVAFSLLPLAAPVILPLRAAFAALPLWQAGASVAIQVFCMLGAVWLAGRALRQGTLRHGRRRRRGGLTAQEKPPLTPPRTAHGVEASSPPAHSAGLFSLPRSDWNQSVLDGRGLGWGHGKTWRVFCHEFMTTVTRPLYLLVCFALPLLVLAQLGLMLASSPATGSRPALSTALQVDEAALARLISMLVMLLLYGMILMSSGLMLRSVSEEKKNRVMEVLLLSVHPRQLLAGKTIALGLAGLIQAAIWVLVGGLLLALSGQRLTIPRALGQVDGITLAPSTLAWFLVFALLGYALYAGLYAGAGALLPDWRKSRQATLLIALPALIGFQIGLMTTDNPHGPLALIASLFPLTAPFVMVKRLVIAGLPAWQPPLSAGLLALSLPLIARAVARMFHAQNLLSGQPFSVARYWRALLGRE
jgi:ABC-type Na+ efflux pump permease subunit